MKYTNEKDYSLHYLRNNDNKIPIQIDIFILTLGQNNILNVFEETETKKGTLQAQYFRNIILYEQTVVVLTVKLNRFL